MNNTPFSHLISVIVPAYNSEKYIEKCLHSVANQTYNHLEIIVIDDGSSDATGDICEKLIEKIPFLRVFHTQNAGVSAARNFALEKANGEYIVFVDSDDWIEPNMLEELYSFSLLTQADVVSSGIYKDYPNGDTDILVEYEKGVFLSTDFLNDYIKLGLGYSVGKLYRKEILEDIRYDILLSYCEDLKFNFDVILNSSVCSLLDKSFYHYCMNENSVCYQFNSEVGEEFNKKGLHILYVWDYICKNVLIWPCCLIAQKHLWHESISRMNIFLKSNSDEISIYYEIQKYIISGIKKMWFTASFKYKMLSLIYCLPYTICILLYRNIAIKLWLKRRASLRRMRYYH